MSGEGAHQMSGSGDDPSGHHLLVGGCGAVGSPLDGLIEAGAFVVFADRERVARENLGVAAFESRDLDEHKADVAAARYRARGGVGRVLRGDIRYTLRPGLARRLDAAILCLDNATALRDAAEVLWAAIASRGDASSPNDPVAPGARELAVLALTCGGEGDGGGHQVRLFVPPGTCPVCLFGDAERSADRLALGATCADTTAPRASREAAGAAAAAGAAVLAAWLEGDRSLANRRLHRAPGSSSDCLIRMPAEPSPRCPVPHGRHPSIAAFDLGGPIAAVSLGRLAEHALDLAGDDAELQLGRRAVPLGGIYCTACRRVSPSLPLLLPAALATEPACQCGAPRRALGERATIAARELLDPAIASLSLAAWGAGHGEELVAAGSRGRVRLACTFEWSDLDD